LEHAISLDAAGPVLQICLIDLLLSGDNAVVIAMACRSLPERLWRRAVLLGTAAAIGLRVLLTAFATLVLSVRYVKLVGAALLLAIAVKLLEDEPQAGAAPDTGHGNEGMWKAVWTIIVADTVMSLDNVLAVAAASRGSLALLALGLLLSIPILIFGSVLVARTLERFPIMNVAGAALLGWVAGDTAVSDPAIQSWVSRQTFALATAASFLGAAYVLLHDRIRRAGRRRAARRQFKLGDHHSERL